MQPTAAKTWKSFWRSRDYTTLINGFVLEVCIINPHTQNANGRPRQTDMLHIELQITIIHLALKWKIYWRIFYNASDINNATPSLMLDAGCRAGPCCAVCRVVETREKKRQLTNTQIRCLLNERVSEWMMGTNGITAAGNGQATCSISPTGSQSPLRQNEIV